MSVDGIPTKSLFRRGDAWAKATDVAYATLWFEFLKISPSYELARRFRTGEWTAADDAARPADFEAVLSVYDDLGDVRALRFREWWTATAIEHFGYRGSLPRVTHLATVGHGAEDNTGRLIAKAEAYLERNWAQQGKPTAMVVAIPVGLSKARLAQQIATLLEAYSQDDKSDVISPPKYRLVSRKLDHKSLFKYLMCVWVKAKLPEASLWRIGVLSKISLTYSGRMDANEKLGQNEKYDERNALKILTSRALSRGIQIAENAARGHFPTYARHQHSVPPDWIDLREAVKRRVDLDRAS